MRQGRHTDLFLDVTACFLLPAYTLLFAGARRWLSTNFSVLAMLGEEFWRGFVVWGVLMGGYFLVVLLGLGATLPSRGGRWSVNVLASAALCALLGALLTPYLPGRFPIHARRHVALAMAACVMLMASLGLVIWQGLRESPARYRVPALGWLLLAAGCGALLVLGGMVTSALEVYFAIGSVLLGRRLWQLRRR